MEYSKHIELIYNHKKEHEEGSDSDLPESLVDGIVFINKFFFFICIHVQTDPLKLEV